jgi:hypothetical protein
VDLYNMHFLPLRVLVVTNSVNIGRRTAEGAGETQSIGSSKYKNLKLKEKEEKRRSSFRRVAFKESSGHMRYGP